MEKWHTGTGLHDGKVDAKKISNDGSTDMIPEHSVRR